MDTTGFKYRIRKVVPVVSKKDPICSNIIPLLEKKANTFGRIMSDEVNIRLLSKVTPLMISRKHATITCDEGRVTIVDHHSINGVYINGRRIKPEEPQELHVGEKIGFGCAMGNLPCEFEYILEQLKPVSKQHLCSSLVKEDYSPTKRHKKIDSSSLTVIEANASQIKEHENKIKYLSDELRSKEEKQDVLKNKLEVTQKCIIESLEIQKFELEAEMLKGESHLKELLEHQLKEKEALLRAEFDQHICLLEYEKKKVEKNLQDELSNKLSEKDEVYKLELEQQKIALENAMIHKENEKNSLIAQLQVKECLLEKYKSVEENQKQLELCLSELRKQIEEKESQLIRQKEISRQAECDAKQTVIQIMEDEFTCIICQELFIGATTLSCAHTFCELCLMMWMKKKKSCPVCRRKIKGKAVHSVVLDSAVEKMVEAMDEDTLKRRAELKQERDELKRRDIAVEGPDGIRSWIHSPDDSDESDEIINRNVRVMPNNNRHRQRSRSRTPRNHRNRPYYDNRPNPYNGTRQIGENNFTFHNQYVRSDQVYQPRFQSRVNGYYQQPGNFNHEINYQFFNNLRCFHCGDLGHLDRFCPRR
ncbi:E3 ubiquitin-protein ligase rnf8 [Hydra vulgaris]|uniref:E3 ubiquitin-protein ligase rnf8 n=1 Tax=Hydra vulgaris TaxID=6087 RepID=UPI0002B40BC0|nr:E3 ubiquitin-protein ligase rnf8 [Hydra vulgaris]